MPVYSEISQQESDKLSAIKTIDSEIHTLDELKKTLDSKALTKALDVMQFSKAKVVVTGMGKSGHIGRKIAAALASTGTPSFFVHPADSPHFQVYNTDLCFVSVHENRSILKNCVS